LLNYFVTDVDKGVAFSGGSDSLALLYLLKQVATTTRRGLELPQQIYAITIDHQLQASSSNHAVHCAAWAQNLAVPHKTMKISWGTGLFPPRPATGESFEHLARDCRYRLLFEAMTELDLDCLAMGHHLDDQVETMIMRYMKGTRGTGLAGMRPCRRWGMGSSDQTDPLRWFAHAGMARWIVRPLLMMPKV
jgi:tRNA(Ile)-lysidine synthase